MRGTIPHRPAGGHKRKLTTATAGNKAAWRRPPNRLQEGGAQAKTLGWGGESAPSQPRPLAGKLAWACTTATKRVTAGTDHKVTPQARPQGANTLTFTELCAAAGGYKKE